MLMSRVESDGAEAGPSAARPRIIIRARAPEMPPDMDFSSPLPRYDVKSLSARKNFCATLSPSLLSKAYALSYLADHERASCQEKSRRAEIFVRAMTFR